MAIDLNNAYNQANKIEDQIVKLRQSKCRLQTYKTSLTSNWKGPETAYLFGAIDKSIKEINSVIFQLTSLKQKVKSVATAIKREDDEAEARRRAAKLKAQQIEKAKRELSESVRKYNDKVKVINDLKAKHNASNNKTQKAELRKQIERLQKELEKEKTAIDAKKKAIIGLSNR